LIATRRFTAAASEVERLESRRLLSGAPDPAFGDGGRYVVDLGHAYDSANALAIQADGRIIAAGNGDSADVIRLTPDGRRDPSFVYPAALDASKFEFWDVAIQTDGKVLVGGWKELGEPDFFNQPVVIRFNSDGSLDPTFGTGGVAAPFGKTDGQVTCLDVRPDGRILFGGNWAPSGYHWSQFVGRLNPNGTVDTAFGTGGKTVVNFGGSYDEAIALLVLPDGRLLLGGWGYYGDDANWTLLRLTATGQRDTTFDGDGLKKLSNPSDRGEELYDMALMPDGRIVGVGSSERIGIDGDTLIALIDSNGVYQTDFGVGGRVVVNLGGDLEQLEGVVVDAAGTIYAGGAVRMKPTWSDYDWDYAVLSYTRGGAPNPNFNGGSPRVSNFNGNYEISRSIAVASPTRLLIGGEANDNFAANLAVVAYTITPPAPPPAGGSISGTIFNDLDADGSKDSGEGPLAGWQVFIDADKDGVLDAAETRTTTDAAGNYRFANLAAGAYRVRQVRPSGWRATSPSSGYRDVTLAGGQSVTGRNFANTQTVLISGTLFNDLDGDGAKDSGEAGLSGWRVYIDADNDGVFDSIERSVLTDSSGNYKFNALPAGTYRVREVRQSGWRVTAPGGGVHTLTLSGGQTATSKRFGNTRNVLISGTVFNDLDGDRVRDGGEAGLGGWRVFIDADADGVFDSTEISVPTDSSGNYRFTTLGAGTYRLRVVQPSGWARTSPTGGYFSVTLLAGASRAGLNFGLRRQT
jgi:uncharacterized delta-60 repeat protein